MSFLENTPKQLAGQQVISWYNSAISSMQSAKGSFDSLTNQIESMKTNEDYTQEDIDEVIKLKQNILDLASQLTA